MMVVMMMPGGKSGRSGYSDEEKCNHENLFHVPNPTTILQLRGVPGLCGTKTANGASHGTSRRSTIGSRNRLNNLHIIFVVRIHFTVLASPSLSIVLSTSPAIRPLLPEGEARIAQDEVRRSGRESWVRSATTLPRPVGPRRPIT
jgi:hypothetical protein